MVKKKIKERKKKKKKVVPTVDESFECLSLIRLFDGERRILNELMLYRRRLKEKRTVSIRLIFGFFFF